MILISVDPGQATGLFACYNDGEAFMNHDRHAYTAMRELEELLNTYVDSDVHVVCERFTVQSTRITPQYDALEVTGVVKWLCSKHGAELTLQSRSQKSLVNSFMLKQINWWATGTRGHGNDAARHALIWLAAHRPEHTVVQRTVGTIAATG